MLFSLIRLSSPSLRFQGLEIVNPNAAEEQARVDEANAKYFSSSAAFMKVKTPKPPATATASSSKS